MALSASRRADHDALIAELAHRKLLPKRAVYTWTMAPRVVKPSTEALEESPHCVESDSKLLVNDDHHGQR